MTRKKFLSYWRVPFALAVMAAVAALPFPLTAQAAEPPPDPSITRVSGTPWDWDKAPCWRGHLVVDYYRDKTPAIYITGSNFGSDANRGSVTTDNVYYRDLTIEDWSETAIRIRLTSSLKATPLPLSTDANDPVSLRQPLTLTVTRNDGRAVSTQVRVVPAIKTRVYRQCTHYAALTRLLASKSIPTSAYSFNFTINASYEPQTLDVLMWGDSHTAIIGDVSSAVTDDKKGNRTIKYTIRIDQSNAAPPYGESLSSYTTGATVKVKYDPKTGREISRTLESPDSAYRFSNGSKPATVGWR